MIVPVLLKYIGATGYNGGLRYTIHSLKHNSYPTSILAGQGVPFTLSRSTPCNSFIARNT